MIERTNAATRPSSPRISRISSTTARYSRSSSRVLPSTGTSSGCGSTSTRSWPSGPVLAAPIRPRWRPSSATARPPPGSLMWSATSATVPTEANSSPLRGTSTTRSSPATSIARVTVMVGKTTESSTGTRSIVSSCLLMISEYRDGKSARCACESAARGATRGRRKCSCGADSGRNDGRDGVRPGGGGLALPVELVRFGWADTRRRLASLLPDAALRAGDDGSAPYVTDEGHYILDCAIPADTDPATLDAALAPIPGVVEHGLFLDMASLALLGSDGGNVER